MEPMDPRFVPKLARQIATWQRTYGPTIWPMKGLSGSKFFAPPSLPPLPHETAGYELNSATGNAMRIPSQRTVEGYRLLVDYYAETLENAKCFHLDEKMSNLALRTVMAKYTLTRDMLRIGPSGEMVPWGFITWALPISVAENYTTANLMVDFRTGEVDRHPDMPEFSPFADGDFPVVAASWRYEPEANVVWVAFYTQNSDHLRIMERDHNLSPAELAKAKKLLEPLALEREQALPLDRTLNWCDADPKDGPRLEMTAFTDPYDFPEALRPETMERNEAAQALVSNMVRVLVATWVIMKYKVASREVIPPTQDVIRKISKETKTSKEQVAREHGTTVVSLGAPIKKRAPQKKGEKHYSWSVQTLIGPILRDRQYIPAWDTYDEEPRWIEPYWAGPPDAPISARDKVFVLEDPKEAIARRKRERGNIPPTS